MRCFLTVFASRTCPLYGFEDKRKLACRWCGFSDHADRVAAVNIAARAAVNRPIVGWHEGSLLHAAAAS
nr:zinc ribbon domain-containing protein [Thermus islandicus]